MQNQHPLSSPWNAWKNMHFFHPNKFHGFVDPIWKIEKQRQHENHCISTGSQVTSCGQVPSSTQSTAKVCCDLFSSATLANCKRLLRPRARACQRLTGQSTDLEAATCGDLPLIWTRDHLSMSEIRKLPNSRCASLVGLVGLVASIWIKLSQTAENHPGTGRFWSMLVQRLQVADISWQLLRLFWPAQPVLLQKGTHLGTTPTKVAN